MISMNNKLLTYEILVFIQMSFKVYKYFVYLAYDVANWIGLVIYTSTDNKAWVSNCIHKTDLGFNGRLVNR